MADIRISGQTFGVEIKLVVETCCNCGMVFAMPEDFKRDRLKKRPNDKSFFCPRGHGQHYQGKSEAGQLREKLGEEQRLRQRAEQNVAMWRDDAQEQRDKAERERRRANGYKGHATRITKRAKAGACPCCNRTFTNMARHMATKHPTFTPIELEETTPLNPSIRGRA